MLCFLWCNELLFKSKNKTWLLYSRIKGKYIFTAKGVSSTKCIWTFLYWFPHFFLLEKAVITRHIIERIKIFYISNKLLYRRLTRIRSNESKNIPLTELYFFLCIFSMHRFASGEFLYSKVSNTWKWYSCDFSTLMCVLFSQNQYLDHSNSAQLCMYYKLF